MPLPITKYCCSLCGAEYRDFYEASNCEALGMPREEDGILVGQTVTFQNEEQMLGTRWSYSSLSGTVILKYINLNANPNSRAHTWAYVIRDDSSWRHVEHVAMFITSDLGYRSLTSLHEWKYTIGFADHVRQQPGVICG